MVVLVVRPVEACLWCLAEPTGLEDFSIAFLEEFLVVWQRNFDRTQLQLPRFDFVERG